MTRKYKLERLQKNILLGVSGMTIASAMFFGGPQDNKGKFLNIETIITSASEVKILNKAEKENARYFSNKYAINML